MHDDAYIGGRSENYINASCMTISGGRTKQLDIFCRVTGFMSDFLSFIVVELIWLFHGALQLVTEILKSQFNYLIRWLQFCCLHANKDVVSSSQCLCL